MEEQKRVPKLRFGEFSGEWEEKKLEDVSKFYDGKRKPIKSSDRAKMQGQYPYYGASGVIDYVNDFIFDDEIVLLGEDGENILSRNLPLAFRVSGKCWVNNHAHVIKPKKHYDVDFLALTLENVNYQKYNTGTAQPKLNQEVCSKIKCFYPSFSEQQKIASFLSAVDKKITQLQQKQRLLEAYKKGVMQRIFSQELRFTREDGSAYPDWKEQKMRDVAPLQRGFDLPTSKIIEGDYPVVYSNGILRKHKEFKVNAPGVITGRSGTIGQVTYINEKFWPHNTSLWVTDFKGNYPKFIYYLYHFFKLERFNAGSTVPTLNRNDVHAVKKHIPIRPEQTQIAHFLSAIDIKIAVVESQIEQTQQFKKGLLQQMFA